MTEEFEIDDDLPRPLCPHDDLFCVCPDGDTCHYEYDPVTDTPAAPCWRTGIGPDSSGRSQCGCAARAVAAQLNREQAS